MPAKKPREKSARSLRDGWLGGQDSNLDSSDPAAPLKPLQDKESGDDL